MTADLRLPRVLVQHPLVLGRALNVVDDDTVHLAGSRLQLQADLLDGGADGGHGVVMLEGDERHGYVGVPGFSPTSAPRSN